MTLACDHCGETIEFRAMRPKFCGFCGNPLSEGPSPATTAPGSRDAPTIVHTPSGHDASPSKVAPPPDQIGGYRLLKELGRGGMGTVYEAEETVSGRKVALKLLAPEITAAPEALDRFRQEGRLASTISHPRCVFVLNADEDEGQPFIVMELMPGSTLQDLVTAGGPLGVDQAVPKILDVLEGLREAHRLGLIHRDVKPSNCFVDGDGRVKVGDFGLSKSLVDDTNLTRTGAFLGTPLYASPEQIKGDTLDARTDVYSVAATLYYLLAGRAPFQGSDAAATLAKIVSEPPPPIRSLRPEISPELERILMRGLERNRDRRYRDLGEFAEALLPFSPGRLQIGGFGLRVAAYVLESQVPKFLIITIVATLIAFATKGKKQLSFQSNYFTALGLDTLFFLVAFLVIEPIWGASPGKWLFNLRVRGQGTSSPGPRTILVRNLIFWGISGFPTVAVSVGMVLAGRTVNQGIMFALRFAGLLLVASPMRASNGYAGLHDRFSSTRVVSLPTLRKRRMAHARRALGRDRNVTTRPVGVLRSIGPYKIRGAVRWEEGRKVLAAEDSSLGREVWIVLRPRSSPSPEPSRRELARATRPRWLSGGEQPEGRWDAYIAPAGCPIADLAGPEGLSWRDARPILEDVVDELDSALKDGTLPRGLTVDQVWIQPDGRAMIVDQLGITEGTGESPGRFDEAREFLREVAAVMLMGGRRRTSERGEALRAAIPMHARDLLDRLEASPMAIGDFSELRTGLDATQDRPVEVTRSHRLVQIGAMSALALMGLLILFGTAFLAFAGRLNMLPLPGPRGEPYYLASEAARGFIFTMILGIPALYVLSSAVSKGGMVLRMTGCGLARRDGRPASRLRCALRSLFVWSVPATLLCLAAWIQGNHREADWPSWTLFTLALIYVVACPFLALIRPERGVHDRLAGTVVVPL